jgi:hypothetical protein
MFASLCCYARFQDIVGVVRVDIIALLLIGSVVDVIRWRIKSKWGQSIPDSCERLETSAFWAMAALG